MADKFYCMYCGINAPTVRMLTGMSCTKSPSKFHVPYEGGEKPKYTCKYCGITSQSIIMLTGMSCTKSPTQHHVPLL